MSHAQDLLAIHRRIQDEDVAAAVQLWTVFGRLKNELNLLQVVAIATVGGEGNKPAYRRRMEASSRRIDVVAADLERLREDDWSPHLRGLWQSLRSLADQIRLRATRDPRDATELWERAMEAYALGRELAKTRWAFEMRPEGLPLRPEAAVDFRLLA
ncbi:hypothetical protein [Euzebya tangerina]|uniref:hypothetical protein n=1 Tax=Euzebya tangerina TaxID=591198 RepID=UPI0013C33B23|nr:hypothetical protein [Euzebya tangerina]